MLKIKNTIMFAALFCGLIISFAAAPQKAAAQFAPEGSYKITCNQIYLKNATLVAYCKPKNSKDLNLTSLADVFTCSENTISNEDGVLKCNRNENSPLMKKAKAAIDIGYANALGNKISGKEEYFKFIRLMFANNMVLTFYHADYEKLEVSNLLQFFRRWMAKPENAQLKNQIIDRVFNEVYGRGPGTEEMSKNNGWTFSDGQSYVYDDILFTEKNLLNSFPISRKIAIGKAYLISMGRQPTKTETEFWLPKNEYYRQIVEANRAYLYSPNGLGDLRDTVRRAWKTKTPNEQNLAQIDALIELYRPNRKIYDEIK